MHLKQQKHISSYRRQSGWTMWSLMFTLGVITLFAYIGFQLVPFYSSNENVKSAMQLALDNVNKQQVSRSAVIKTMRNKLYLDGSHELLDFKKDLDIKRSQRELIINVEYERRVHLFFNISLVATFNNEVKAEL